MKSLLGLLGDLLIYLIKVISLLKKIIIKCTVPSNQINFNSPFIRLPNNRYPIKTLVAGLLMTIYDDNRRIVYIHIHLAQVKAALFRTLPGI